MLLSFAVVQVVMYRTSALVLLSLGLPYSGKEVIATSTNTKAVDAYIYTDNFFDLFVNGEFVSSDSRFIPHTAFQSTLNLNQGRDNVIAVYLRDNANLTTGLEYGDRCVGDAGFRFRALDDSIVSNSSWKCRTVHYGPINPEQCYGLGLDTTGNYSAFSDEDDGLAKTLALARSVNPISACRDSRVRVFHVGAAHQSYSSNIPCDCTIVAYGAYPCHLEILVTSV